MGCLTLSALGIRAPQCSKGIHFVHRIIPNIGREVEVILMTDRIGLHETPDLRRVVPGTVVVQPGFRVITLTRIAIGDTACGR